jgi:hypothetical protein
MAAVTVYPQEWPKSNGVMIQSAASATHMSAVGVGHGV